MENIPGTLTFICVSVTEAVKDYFWKDYFSYLASVDNAKQEMPMKPLRL